MATIPKATYLYYAGSSICNIAWIYLFNNYYAQFALVFIFLLGLFLYAAVAATVIHLHCSKGQEGTMKVVDVWAT